MSSTIGRRQQTGKSGNRTNAEVRAEGKLRVRLESGAIWLLLLAAVVSAISGSGPAMFSTMLTAWTLFPFLVGLKNTLDAGCFFMLVTVGIVGTVDLARSGAGYLLP